MVTSLPSTALICLSLSDLHVALTVTEEEKVPACQLSTQAEGTEQEKEALKVALLQTLNSDLTVIRVLKKISGGPCHFILPSLLSGSPHFSDISF